MAYRLFTLLPLLATVLGSSNMANSTIAADLESAESPALGIQVPTQPSVSIISHEQANAVIGAAVKKANELKMPSNIAVTDPFGHLVSFLRMDGAVLVSIDVAIKKAKTVSMFGGKYRSGDLYNATAPGGALYGIERTNSGLIFFHGGVPLKINGAFVGSLGVSGGTVEQDTAISSAAAASFNQVTVGTSQAPAQIPAKPATIPQISAKAPQIPAQAPQVPAQAPPIPTQAAQIPTQPPYIPVQAPQIPPKSPQIPAKSPWETWKTAHGYGHKDDDDDWVA